MTETTLAAAYQDMLDKNFAAVLQTKGIDAKMALDIARGANEGKARAVLIKNGINPDQEVFIDDRGQCVAACGQVLIPAPGDGPGPGRRSVGLAKIFGVREVVTVDATPVGEVARAAAHARSLGF